MQGCVHFVLAFCLARPLECLCSCTMFTLADGTLATPTRVNVFVASEFFSRDAAPLSVLLV